MEWKVHGQDSTIFATSFQGQAVLGRIEKYPGEHSKLSKTVLQYPASAFNIAGSIAILEDDSPQATFLSICNPQQFNFPKVAYWKGGQQYKGSLVARRELHHG